MSVRARADAVIVGAGHNGLVAAVLLARAGLDVFVVERDRVVGGAARTERPFAVAPELAMSPGAPLLGAMPPELLAELGVELPLLRRDPHTVLATTGDRCVLFGADREATRRRLVEQFSQDDGRADEALRAELAALRDDLAPSWLAEPLGLEQTAERYVRPALRGAFVELCRGSVGGYLDRFGFRSELVKAMYAAGPRSSAGIDEPGSGAALLAHHMGRLPGAGDAGTAVRGGLGTVTQNLAYAAVRAGARFVKGDGVTAILCGAGAVTGVALDSEREIETDTVVCNADPFRMRALVGRDRFPDDYNARLDGCRRDGTAFALHLALSALPELACTPGRDAPFRGAIHLLPGEGSALDGLRRARDDARAGRLPELPAVEWITHTAADPSLSDADGRHAASLYVHPVPYRLADREWDAEAGRFTRRLLAICDRFAPGTSERVIETVAVPPPELARRFGLPRGHIHHVDNAFAFADRVPYATPIDGLYTCSAATHPAGGVIGAAGHNAAKRVLADRRH